MKAAGAVQRSILLTVLTSVGACQLVGGYDQFTPARDAGAGGADGGIDSSVHPDVDSDAQHPSCVDLPDVRFDLSNMRRVSNGSTCFWMDRTEVSRAEYLEFLELAHPAPNHPSCGDNRYDPAPLEASAGETCHVPAGVKLSSELDHPIVCVDWCDALGYCTSLGKTLCKDAILSTPAGSDWYAACSNASNAEPTAYPFGNEYKKVCNDENHPAAGCGPDLDCFTTVPVGSLAECANTAGVLHLAGNVHEWTEACSGDAGCYVRGGSMQTRAASLRCKYFEEADRAERDATIGFRCCYHAPR